MYSLVEVQQVPVTSARMHIERQIGKLLCLKTTSHAR